MAGIGDVIGSLGQGGGNVFWILIMIVVIGGGALLLLGVGGYFWWRKRRWNLRVEFKLPRSDGRIITGEWGAGYYNAKRGVVFIKRKGMKTVPMKVFDVKKYLQGLDLLTVIQVAPEDYRPVLNDSWTSFIDDKTGEKVAVMNIKIDSGLNKAWKSAFESAAKKAYSLESFLSQFQTPIAIGIVIISVFVGFAMVWTRLGTICG